MDHVGDMLRQHKNICYLAFVLGSYDLLAIVVAQNREELAEFIMHRVANVPGILHTETFATLKIIKGEATLLDTFQLLEDLNISRKNNRE